MNFCLKYLALTIIVLVYINEHSIVDGYKLSNQHKIRYKTRVKKTAERISNYLINDILPKYRTAADSDDNECNTIEDIDRYFFNVYGSENATLESEELKNIIDYNALKTRDKDLQNRHDQFKCKRDTCFKAEEILKMANVTSVTENRNFEYICPMLLYNIELEECVAEAIDNDLSTTLVWVIGLVFASIITVWSWLGAFVLPVMGKPIYKKILAFMISLACGTVLSNSILNFIPMADGFFTPNLENPNSTYFFKHLLILCIIFFFFNFERTMKLIAFYKKEKSDRLKKLADLTSINQESTRTKANARNDSYEDDEDLQMQKMKRLKKSPSIDITQVHVMGVPLSEVAIDIEDKINKQNQRERKSSDADSDDVIPDKSAKICCTSLSEGMSNVRPIGWMALFGDGLSNFIDGLSVGAAMNQGLVEGLTVSISVWLGNIPQELGDFALLIRAGMSPFQALFYNYISALSAYIGFTVGCIAGSSLQAAKWIFAISGATTMYMGLAVLLPEMVEEFEETEPFTSKLKITVIQNLGIIVGYVTLILLNAYEDEINF